MDKNGNNKSTLGGLVIRILLGALVIGITAFFTPGFRNSGGPFALIIAAIVIGLLDYLVVNFTGLDASPFGKGVVGFLVTAVILYVTGMLVSGLDISVIGALIGALVMGVVESIIPVGR